MFVESVLEGVGGVVGVLMLVAYLALEEVRQKLVEDVEVGHIDFRVVLGARFDDVVAEQMRLDAPALSQPHDDLLHEEFVFAEHGGVGGAEQSEVVEVEDAFLVVLDWRFHPVDKQSDTTTQNKILYNLPSSHHLQPNTLQKLAVWRMQGNTSEANQNNSWVFAEKNFSITSTININEVCLQLSIIKSLPRLRFN